MEKRKWLWKRKSSERSPGESESSESLSSHSERCTDEQEVEALKESPNGSLQSPEVISKAAALTDDGMKESVKSLTEKLSAALVNVSAKEELVKQHAKVAEEAVAGWEKAENEAAALKQQLESAVQQNLNLEVRSSHLDNALKECVRQLRQARDDQDKSKSEWESAKAELENQIFHLQSEAKAQNSVSIIEALEKENSTLKQQLISCCNELEIMSIERDLSTQAAESASKLQLESIKKVAKLEAECRRLQSLARKSSPMNDMFKSDKPSPKSVPVKIDMMDDFLEMERLAALPETKNITPLPEESILRAELDSTTQRITELENKLEMLEAEKLELQIALDDNVNSLKAADRAEFNSMTNRVTELENKLELIEAEKLELQNALDETVNSLRAAERVEFDSMAHRVTELENKLEMIEAEKVELQNALDDSVNSLKAAERVEFDAMTQQVNELENKLGMVEAEKVELQNALDETVNSLKAAEVKVEEGKNRLEELQKELASINETKELLEFQLIDMEAEGRTLSANVGSLKVEVEEERKVAEELRVKCRDLENELSRTIQDVELHQNANSNAEVKIKQEDLAVAADKLAECQKTIASLGRQLQSLSTLEDFLIDTSNIPGFSRQEIWRLPSNDMLIPERNSDSSRMSLENDGNLENGNEDSSSSLNKHVTAAKSQNSFGKFFSRSKSVVEFDPK